jgi:hypothetical protein
LVAAAAEMQFFIAQSLYESSVNKDIYLLQQGALCRVFNQALEQVACVAPDIFAAFLPDCACKRRETFGLEHGVAAREGDIGKGVGKNGFKNLFCIYMTSVGDIP